MMMLSVTYVALSAVFVLAQSKLFGDIDDVKSYKYHTYSEIVNIMLELNNTYPQFVELYVGEDLYNLTSPPEMLCEVNKRMGPCKHYIVRITNEESLPDPERPEVFFSGALHGDERIGPLAVTELMLLLVQHRSDPKGSAWLKRLVDTRAIYMMPTTNSYGFYKDSREENGIDTNRDYNYMRSGTSCMVTMTSRVVNELWRDHIFQLSITFHGGMRAVAYEWGSNNHYKNVSGIFVSEKSPDDAAQVEIGSALAEFAGSFIDRQFYPAGMMNEVVYGVDGGMEDWAYAASWENQYTPDDKPKPFQPCKPTTYGGYAENRTIYNNVTHRTFNMLVETSDKKDPREGSLGTSEALSHGNIQNFLGKDHPIGHVPRNMRLALMIIDVVQPYIMFKSNVPIQCGDNAVLCQIGVVCDVPIGSSVMFAWEVFGAFTVDSTQLIWSRTSKFSANETNSSARQHGVTRWANKGPASTTFFTQCILASQMVMGSMFYRVVATVDQGWAEKETTKLLRSPNIPPQSHIVNARTNDNWNMENNGHRVVGKSKWFSDIIQVNYGVAKEIMNSTVSSSNTSATNFPETTAPGDLAFLGYIIAGVIGLVIGIIGTSVWFRVIKKSSYAALSTTGNTEEEFALQSGV